MSKTLVSITVDTEPSIARAYEDIDRFKPQFDGPVFGNISGNSEALGFLVSTLGKYNFSATFFLEVLSSRYFGLEPLQRCAAFLQEGGQDVQLHMHPTWQSFEAGRLVRVQRDDRSTGRPADELREIFEEGQERFEDITGKPAIAMRTGNFSTGLDSYDAAQGVGIRVASNVCHAHAPAGDAQLQQNGGSLRVGDILELPVTCFQAADPRGGSRLRPMQVCAASFAEMREVLDKTHAAGVRHVVIVTHPFEFLKKRDATYRDIKPNRLVQRRFDRLCAYLHSNSDRFDVVSMADHAEYGAATEPQDIPVVSVRRASSIARLLANAVNDRLWGL